MIGYKLTNQDMQTHKGFQWELDVWKTATGDSTKACSDGVLHYYEDPLLAILFNPIHADIHNPRLFEVEIEQPLGTDGLKSWCKKQKLVEEIPVPTLTTVQKTAFAILAALKVYEDKNFEEWAMAWLTGKDRGTAAAARAAWAAWAAAEAARAAWAARAAATNFKDLAYKALEYH